jgi:hypothetical protein
MNHQTLFVGTNAAGCISGSSSNGPSQVLAVVRYCCPLWNRAWLCENPRMMKTYWIGLMTSFLFLAGCGSSSQQKPIKDAAVDSQTGHDSAVSQPDTSAGDALILQDTPASPQLDVAADSPVADADRDAPAVDGPQADGVVVIADAPVADLATDVDAATPTVDGAVNNADGLSGPQTFPCNDDTDCCIKIDTCLNDAYMYSMAQGASPEPTFTVDDYCTLCIPPAIQVRCEKHQCVGERIPSYTSGPLLTNHCGTLQLSDLDAHELHDFPDDAGASTPTSVWSCVTH